jgi:membrane protease subunit HflC
MTTKTKLGILGALAVVMLFIGLDTFYTVDETQTAIVLELGRPVGGAKTPGLHFKKPLIQQVTRFDARVLEYDAQPAEILTKDKKNMIMDSYLKWKIIDPLMFYRTVQTVQGAQSRLDDIVYAELRVALGRFTMTEIVQQGRGQIMADVTKKSTEIISQYGIEVVDVRIKRTDLPPENERAIFGRMRAERERQAKQYRSEGQEEAVKIKSAADRERTVLIAEAERESAVLRGEGEAQAARIYADALQRSPELFAFKRSMDAYERAFKDNTRVILTPDSGFLRFLR